MIIDKMLVTTHWLQDQLDNENLLILYTQMDNPVTGAKEAKPKGYIPNSLLFDFENVFCDSSSIWPHTMPSVETFQEEAAKLGLTQDAIVVVYDNKGIYCAPRVWWMLTAMGVKNAYVLDGGLPKWQKENRLLNKELSIPVAVNAFNASYYSTSFITAENIIKNRNILQIVDARSAGRFDGTAPEPRVGLRSGHAPGAINLPFTELINGTELKSKTELIKIFSQLKLNPNSQLVFSCGSGVTACIVALAASQVGFKNLTVYDGSWAEWGAREDLPLEL